MLRACKTSTNSEAASDSITLNETDRHRRRMMMRSDNGIEFLLDLPTAQLLRHGEKLVLDDGRTIEVLAEPEPLYCVTASDGHHLLQLAWQLGNRHLATEIAGDELRIRRDSVIRTMLEGLGAKVEDIEAPFNPQGGAYDQPHHHSSHKHSLDQRSHD